MVADRQPVVACCLERVAYGPTWTLQQKLQNRLIEAKRKQPPEHLPHVLLLLEHPPVYTLGKSGDARNMLLDQDGMTRRGAQFHHIDRGGDITFHGPGQVVGYFLLDLDGFYRDLHRFLRALEEVVIRTCADYGLNATRIAGRTGVWIGSDAVPERKICAFGIRSSRWVTMHGMAFNVNTDLSYFQHIIPCGIQDRGVTSLARELGLSCDIGEVRGQLIRHVESVFEAHATVLEGDAAFEYLEELTETRDLRRTLSPQAKCGSARV